MTCTVVSVCAKVVYACVILVPHLTWAFNLDPRIPVIKYGNLDTYFGYSVAEHQIEAATPGGEPTNVILVGAPLGQNYQPETNRSGALFRCAMTTKPNDCVQVITDGQRLDESDDVTLLDPPSATQTKDGQWMGAVVRSQGSLVLVCAHRYMENYWGNGLCYTLTNDLKVDNYLELCAGRPRNRAHEEFGYCQAGTSGAFLNDGTVIVGAPGPYTWRGTLFVLSMHGDYLSRDKTVYHGPFNEFNNFRNQPVDKYSYLGMSVTGGHFFNNTVNAFAAGGPRSKDTGQVVLFKQTPKAELLDVVSILDGQQFASSFGYEIAAADLNGDGLDELIVGAPFYFGKHEGGAVYIYTASYKACGLKCTAPVIITGKPESRFGFSIVNLGDLNKDGYQDIAIGAPYEANGAIYIYLGSKDGLITIPSQIITSEDLPIKVIKTLGYSLSAGVDMDNNGYPDLLVGAYEQDAVVLFRARPIIDIKTEIRPMSNLRNIDASKIACDADPTSNYTCFSFQACCSIMSLEKKTRSEFQILNYVIEAETFAGNRQFARVWFAEETGRQHHVVRNMTISSLSNKYCQNHTVYVIENTRDILSPIKFRLNYTLEQQVPLHRFTGPLPVIDNYPILNQQQAEKIFEATFQKNCGANDICESDINIDARPQLKVENDRYILTLGLEEEVKFEVAVTNRKEPAYEAQLFIIHPAGLSYIATVTDKQVLCNVFNATVVACSLGNPFKADNDTKILVRFDPKHLDNDLKKFKFTVFANSTSTEITEKKPKQYRVTIIKNAEVSIKGSTLRTNVIYGGEIKGESAMKFGDDVGSYVSHIYVVRNNGPWKVGRLTIEVSWPYQVANNKPEGKWLLYLEKMPVVNATNGGQCYLTADQVNPLNLTHRPDVPEMPLENLRMPSLFPEMDNPKPSRRTKRYTEVVVRSHTVKKDGQVREVVTMDCEDGSAKCIKFNCTVYNLHPHESALLQIRARLWNSTLVEDYPRIDSVEIRSRARIHIPAEYSIQQNIDDDAAFVDTLAYPDLLNQHVADPVPLWIIIVAVCAGLLLLVLLTLLLWKLGFFKRRRPDPTLSGNLEKHHEESPFLARHDRS